MQPTTSRRAGHAPHFVISYRHGRLGFAICYALDPRPKADADRELFCVPITEAEARAGIESLKARYPVTVTADKEGPKFSMAAATAEAPALAAPLAALASQEQPVPVSGALRGPPSDPAGKSRSGPSSG